MKNLPFVADCYPETFENTSYLICFDVYYNSGEVACANAWTIGHPYQPTAIDIIADANSYRSQGFWVNVTISRNGIVRRRLILKPYPVNYADIRFNTLFD